MREEIIWKEKPSLYLYWPRYVLYPIIALSWLFFPHDILKIELFSGVFFYQIAAVFSVLILFPLLITILNLKCTRYELSDERLIISSGILSRRREVIELYRVKDIEPFIPFHLRIFGYENITIHSSDKTAPKIKLLAIESGNFFEEEIRERVEEMRRIKGVREFD